MPKKVLSVSDNDALRVTRHMMLQNRRFDVVSAANLREVRNAVKAGDFDLVILGHTVPAKDKDGSSCTSGGIAIAQYCLD